MAAKKVLKPLFDRKSLSGQVAIVTGASRGIGRDICLTFARAGANIVVAAKSTDDQPNLPGTIYSVAKEVESLGVQALAVQVDVRDDNSIQNMVDQAIKKFGRIDILINNAGALWWKKLEETPMKRYDLINGVNARGTFACTRAVLPYMLKQGHGHIIVMSPPIDLSMLPGKVAYCISKFGMTMIAHGLAEEVRGHGVAINALWPATMVESYATINFQLGDPSLWRKASIISDCCLSIVSGDPEKLSGKALIDEDYLRTIGATDFSEYRCDPNVEPQRVTSTYVEAGLVSEVKNLSKL